MLNARDPVQLKHATEEADDDVPIVSSSIIVGDVRVQALSSTLVRVEPKGPRGFEDRTTFMVVNRSFPGLAITKKAVTAAGTLLSTTAYDVLLRHDNSSSISCGVVTSAADVVQPKYTDRYPNGTIAAGREACCKLCDTEEMVRCGCFTCVAREKTCGAALLGEMSYAAIALGSCNLV